MARAGRRRATQRRLLTAAISVVGHAGLFLALVFSSPAPPKLAEPKAMAVALVAPPSVAIARTPPSAVTPSPVEPPPPPRHFARPARVRADTTPLPAGEGRADSPGVELSDAELASASAAGSGASGGACDMGRRLQAALRRDPQVQAAVADAHHAPGALGKALFVWNGDWIRSRGQDGNGLAAVREAIMWEVAFAPEACRTQHVRGLILISMNDRPDSAGVVVGSGQWRWSDLLHPRPGG